MLYGPRVTLRAMTEEDYPRKLEFLHDVEFELAGGGDPPRPHLLSGVTEFMTERAKDSLGFAIEADGRLIGDIGLFHLNRVNGTAEVGIGIGVAEYRGRGYGREAMALIVDYGFRLQNLRRIWLEVHGNNERAQRSYRAVGFRDEGRQREHVWLNGSYIDLLLMGLLRSEWSGLPAEWATAQDG